MNISEKMYDYYEKYKCLPHKYPIIRDGIENDALPIVVVEILYKNQLNFDITKKTFNKLGDIIIAPPDNGIDIFFEREDGDEYSYDIIQVKNSNLTSVQIKGIFASMKRTIKDYLKNPKDVTMNLRKVISATNFDESFEKKCNYYVVHRGDLKNCSGLRDNENIVTFADLEVISNSLEYEGVPKETIKVDKYNNFIVYEQDDEPNKIKQDEKEKRKDCAYLCNLNGYDLAVLSNKYSSTDRGRNILFGQNLRESLKGKSKTYKSMEKTINEEADKFWYYNNGITIVSKKCDIKKENESSEEFAHIEQFSIINGAQTTSALGKYLAEAEANRDTGKIEKLKRVYVLTRILEINEDLFRDSIAIYNNMQNPITSRDMVSNRQEQRRLQQRLLDTDNPIYMEIRRGASKPGTKQFYKHRETNNETLAQLAFAAFFRTPFIAKDKKTTLFNNDYSQSGDFNINEYYHKIFNYSSKDEECGILYRKSTDEIDELLFISQLYRESKKYLKKTYTERLDLALEKYNSIVSDDRALEVEANKISLFKRLIGINNICLFYNIALYYEFKDECRHIEKNRKFKYKDYYDKNNKDYKANLIKEYANKFLFKTIDIIDKNADSSNIGNWIRAKKGEEIFLRELRNEMVKNYEIIVQFKDFIETFKE